MVFAPHAKLVLLIHHGSTQWPDEFNISFSELSLALPRPDFLPWGVRLSHWAGSELGDGSECILNSKKAVNGKCTPCYVRRLRWTQIGDKMGERGKEVTPPLFRDCSISTYIHFTFLPLAISDPQHLLHVDLGLSSRTCDSDMTMNCSSMSKSPDVTIHHQVIFHTIPCACIYYLTQSLLYNRSTTLISGFNIEKI